MNKKIMMSLLCAGLAVASPAHALCTMTTPSINLGVYDPLAGPPAPVLVTVTVSCTKNEVVVVTVDRGLYAPTYSPRFLQQAGSGSQIGYNLYLGTTDTTIWGDGSPGTGTITRTATRLADSNYVGNARVLPAILPASGAYSDVLTFTVTF